MLLSTLAGRFIRQAVFVLPFVALAIAVLTFLKWPYLWGFLNVIEILLYTINGLFAMVPIFGYFDLLMPDAWAGPMSYVLMALPVLAVVPIILTKRKAFEEDDPTIPEKLTKEQEEKRAWEIERRRAKQRKLRRESTSIVLPDDPIAAEQAQRTQLELQQQIKELEDDDEQLFDDIAIHKIEQFEEDLIEIEPGNLDSIREMKKRTMLQREETRVPMQIDKRVLAKRANLMYEMLDHVIDGVTFENLYTVLNGAVLAAGVAFGWYIGVLLSDSFDPWVSDVACG
jgi:hypothetical protein